MLTRTLTWLDNRVGFRKSLDPHAENTHRAFVLQSRLWFELMKRIGVLAVLAAAGKHSKIISILYYISLFMIVAPIATWIERWQLDTKTRNPKFYRPGIDKNLASPMSAGEKPAWSYARMPILIMSIGTVLVVNLGIQNLVMQIGDTLASRK